jgi:murein DD-endopeptidase MepM/ murein hydrolase activator NlpD
MLALSAVAFGVALAAETETEVVIEDQAVAHQINSLNDEIAEKRSNVNSLTRNIEEYKKKIAGLQGSEATVEVEIELLENRAAKTELDIEATREEMSAVDAEIAVLEAQIKAIAEQLERNRSSIADMLRKMDMYDNDLSLQLLFGTDSFAELFARLQELSSVTADLEDALTRAEAEHARLETSRAEQVGKRDRLSELQDQQERQIALLEDERGSKELLLAQTQRSEAQFQAFLSELRQEQQYVNQQIGALQDEVERKLADADSEGQGSDVLSWPVNATRGISATFHDPTYPFRHLFEHSGLDVPVASGTPVTSAAPGYVAWTRTGRMYGNYVMVIHANGVATLYAHLSSIDVEQDQFVGRGETIGLSGGIPGTPGAGLSTGAHLHFEVRVNGIPTDPLNYLYGS